MLAKIVAFVLSAIMLLFNTAPALETGKIDTNNIEQPISEDAYANLSKLNAAASVANALYNTLSSHFGEDVWGDLYQLINQAHSYSPFTSSSLQTEIDTLTTEIYAEVDRLNALPLAADLSLLNAQIEIANSKNLNLCTYETAQPVRDILAQIQENIPEDATISKQSEIDGYTSSLSEAIAALERYANYSVVNSYYAKYKDYMSKSEIYTEDSWEVLEEAVESIDWNVTLSDAIISSGVTDDNQAMVDASAIRLKNAFEQLEYESFTLTFHNNNFTDDTVLDITYGEDTSDYVPVDPVNSGYTFAGWYDDDETFKHPHTFGIMDGNCDVYAKWELRSTTNSVSSTVFGGKVYIRLNGEAEKAMNADFQSNYPTGSKIALRAVANSGSEFLYWYDGNNKIVSTDPVYEFVLTQDTACFAQFADTSGNSYRVVFVDKGNNIISTKYVTSGGSVEPPNLRNSYITGYVFDHWDKEYTDITENLVIRAVYVRKAMYYNITAVGGTIVDKSDDDTYAYDTKITVELDESGIEQGKYFSGWSTDGGKTIVSQKSTYSFYACKDLVVSAVYGDEPVQASPVITITGDKLSSTKVRFIAERSIPLDYRFAESGILLTKNQETVTQQKLRLEMISSHSDIKCGKTTDNSLDGQYSAVLSVSEFDDVYAVAYLIYLDSDGAVHTIYSDVVQVAMY